MIVPPLSEPHRTLSDLLNTGHLRCHFSQFGEDAVLWTYLQGKPPGFYVDVGCHHPFRYSNTALLSIAKGWRGINIDVDQRAIDLFNSYRPNDINVCAAVGRVAGEMEVTFFDDGAVNSLDPVFSSNPRWAHLNPIRKNVRVVPLRDVLNANLPPGTQIGLMNIDVEGLDLEVLESNDWSKFRPEYLAVEINGLNLNLPEQNTTFKFLRSQGYRLAAHAFLTSIFERDS